MAPNSKNTILINHRKYLALQAQKLLKPFDEKKNLRERSTAACCVRIRNNYVTVSKQTHLKPSCQWWLVKHNRYIFFLFIVRHINDMWKHQIDMPLKFFQPTHLHAQSWVDRCVYLLLFLILLPRLVAVVVAVIGFVFILARQKCMSKNVLLLTLGWIGGESAQLCIHIIR